MKHIDELGISPTPWECHKQFVIANDDGSVVAATNILDARIIAAAPELYECLREAVSEMCAAYCDERGLKCRKEQGKCFVQKWVNALAKAAGEDDAL